MKAITTKHHGPTETKGSRISASDMDGNRVIIRYNHTLDARGNHKQAALALMDKMKWGGTLHPGAVKGGYVWVFQPEGQALRNSIICKVARP